MRLYTHTHTHGCFNEEERGITLIALVITIIVLLILAGVSIAMLTGDNGILTQANNSKEKTALAEEEEQRKLLEQEAYMEKYKDVKTELTEEEATAQGWEYKNNNIISYKGQDSVLYFPTKIGNSFITYYESTPPFLENTTITKVIIPSSLKYTDSMFTSCRNIKTAIFEEGLETLGSYTFNGCTNLEYVYLPSTLKTIKIYGLAITGIKNIVIPKSVTTVADGIFGWCKNPITIHCEAESKPAGWSDDWLKYAPEGTTVDWGYKR